MPWGVRPKTPANIVDKGADYVIALKGNQSNLHDDIALFFENLPENKTETASHFDQFEDP